jgi:hypothetical protein
MTSMTEEPAEAMQQQSDDKPSGTQLLPWRPSSLDSDPSRAAANLGGQQCPCCTGQAAMKHSGSDLPPSNHLAYCTSFPPPIRIPTNHISLAYLSHLLHPSDCAALIQLAEDSAADEWDEQQWMEDNGGWPAMSPTAAGGEHVSLSGDKRVAAPTPSASVAAASSSSLAYNGGDADEWSSVTLPSSNYFVQHVFKQVAVLAGGCSWRRIDDLSVTRLLPGQSAPLPRFDSAQCRAPMPRQFSILIFLNSAADDGGKAGGQSTSGGGGGGGVSFPRMTDAPFFVSRGGDALFWCNHPHSMAARFDDSLVALVPPSAKAKDPLYSQLPLTAHARLSLPRLAKRTAQTHLVGAHPSLLRMCLACSAFAQFCMHGCASLESCQHSRQKR